MSTSSIPPPVTHRLTGKFCFSALIPYRDPRFYHKYLVKELLKAHDIPMPFCLDVHSVNSKTPVTWCVWNGSEAEMLVSHRGVVRI